MTPDPAAPLLLFDSGVGGLTVLGKLRGLLPGPSGREGCPNDAFHSATKH